MSSHKSKIQNISDWIFIQAPESCPGVALGGTVGGGGGGASYLHEWHMHRHNFWVPSPLGLGEGSKILFSKHGHVAYQIKDEQ